MGDVFICSRCGKEGNHLDIKIAGFTCQQETNKLGRRNTYGNEESAQDREMRIWLAKQAEKTNDAS